MDQVTRTPPAEDAGLELRSSPGLGAWLAAQRAMLVVSSYQSGKLILIGSDGGGRLAVRHHRFDRAMGLACDGGGLSFATLHQIWRFALVNAPGKDGSSRPFLVPQVSHHTGFVNCHDIARPASGGTLFAATLFNCVGLAQGDDSFRPVWRPPFIRRLAAEDCCHLNGLALDSGRLRFVTTLGQGAAGGEWRHDRSQGAVIDVRTSRIIASDLWMPHSPRIHGRRLWLNASGLGSFGYIDRGRLVEVLACPGYPRGLAFLGDVAAIGVSKPRPASIDGLPLAERLAAKGVAPSAGVLLYDLKAGKVAHSIEFTNGLDELYDVAFLPGTCSAELIHPASARAAQSYALKPPPTNKSKAMRKVARSGSEVL
jgi:uncharacterized protein (TIGR03032 family)